MNKCALLHIMDSPYCFPASENEMVLRLRTAKDDVKSVSVVYESKYVIAEKRKTEEMQKSYTDDSFDYYEAKLLLEDTRLAYVFLVDDGEGKYYFSEDGISETYDFSMGYYNFFQYPYINPVDIVKVVPWMKTAVFYQIFVDRFERGDEKKDDFYINLKWGEAPNSGSFAGGDLKGVTRRLDHIREIGCNAIYLTPVFKSVSNHKYDISDYYEIDPQFGSREDLHELVDSAHKKGMHIVLDAVFNHVSDELMQFKDVLEKGRNSRYFDWFIIHGDHVEFTGEKDRYNCRKCNYETFAACSYMPKLNTSNPEVRDYLINISAYYIREFGIDGWRLDVSDEISHDFWRKFRSAVKAENPDAVIIGENWHNAYSNLRGDQYDSIMNYAFTKLCLDYFATKSKNAREAAWKLNELLMRNKDGINRMMLNLLDSHDTHRIFTQLGRNKRALNNAFALLYFFEGVPCVFYGSEILTEGGYDPDCRRCMDWKKVSDGECADIRELLKALSDMRGRDDFSEGTYSVTSQDDVLIIKNKCQKEYVLMINNTCEAKIISGRRIASESFVICADGEDILSD